MPTRQDCRLALEKKAVHDCNLVDKPVRGLCDSSTVSSCGSNSMASGALRGIYLLRFMHQSTLAVFLVHYCFAAEAEPIAVGITYDVPVYDSNVEESASFVGQLTQTQVRARSASTLVRRMTHRKTLDGPQGGRVCSAKAVVSNGCRAKVVCVRRSTLRTV